MEATVDQSGTYLPGRKPAPGESFADAVGPLLAAPIGIAKRINAVIPPMTCLPAARAALSAVVTTMTRMSSGVAWSARHGLTCEQQFTYTVIPGQMRCVCRCGADRWL